MFVFQKLHSNLVVLSAILALLAAPDAHAKEWRGIVPLHSSRADVERLFGPPTTDRLNTVFYESEKESVAIDYSLGPCAVEFSPWNVPRDTVIGISIIPKSDVKFADLKLDLSKYKKLEDYHVGTIKHYIAEDEGIEYEVDENKGTITLIKYLPTAADEPLRCPESSNWLRKRVKFDEYSDISFQAEKNRLNKFAQQLIRYTSKTYASSEGYILSYAGRLARPGEAAARANRARDYLVKRWYIDSRRIVVRDAGNREKPTIELYLVPPGGTAPLSTPTVEPKDVQIIKRRKGG